MIKSSSGPQQHRNSSLTLCVVAHTERFDICHAQVSPMVSSGGLARASNMPPILPKTCSQDRRTACVKPAPFFKALLLVFWIERRSRRMDVPRMVVTRAASVTPPGTALPFAALPRKQRHPTAKALMSWQRRVAHRDLPYLRALYGRGVNHRGKAIAHC